MMSLFFEDSNSIWGDFNLILEDSNEDDMTLDADDDVAPQSDSGEDQAGSEGEDNTTTQEEPAEDGSDDPDTQIDPDDDPEANADNNADEEDAAEGEEDPNASEEDGEDTGAEDDMGSEEEIDPTDPNAKLKELEKSIFDQLSNEQKALKTKELKGLFDIVYNKCTDIINTISGAERSPDQAKVYDYVMNSLTDLQSYIKDYLFQIFDSKTYIENMVQLQKYLTVLNTVSNIFEEIKKSSDNQNGDN